MTQGDLFDRPMRPTFDYKPRKVTDKPEPYQGAAPYVQGCDASEAASERVEPSRKGKRQQVLDALHRAGSAGLTCDEVEMELRMLHTTASARLRELVLQGLAEDSGKRRKTRSGASAKVWRVIHG